jgi:hypothetical protein
MAIQQAVQVFLTIQGDGVTTTFLFGFTQLFELALQQPGDVILSPGTVPNSVVVLGQDSNLPSSTASVDGFGNLTLTFSTPPAADITGFGNVQLQLMFNSGVLAGTTAAWTSATPVNTTWTLPLNGSNALAVGFVVSGTITSGTILFEVSQNGAAWFPIQGVIPNLYTAITGWTQGVGSLPVQFDVAGFAYFRLRLNPVIVGSGTVTFILQGVQGITEPTPVVGQTDGTKLHITLDDAAGGNSANTVIKGTQGARGLTTQDMKDSGRTPVILYLDSIAGVTAEALATMNINLGGTTSTATHYTVTAGKTLRIQSMYISVRATSAAMVSARARLRSAATVLVGSPVFCLGEASSLAAVAAAANGMDVSIPDGLEFAAGQQVGISQIATAITAAVTVLVVGYEY